MCTVRPAQRLGRRTGIGERDWAAAEQKCKHSVPSKRVLSAREMMYINVHACLLMGGMEASLERGQCVCWCACMCVQWCLEGPDRERVSKFAAESYARQPARIQGKQAPAPIGRKAHSNTTVRLSWTMMRSCRCQRTALASTVRSRSRPWGQRGGGGGGEILGQCIEDAASVTQRREALIAPAHWQQRNAAGMRAHAGRLRHALWWAPERHASGQRRPTLRTMSGTVSRWVTCVTSWAMMGPQSRSAARAGRRGRRRVGGEARPSLDRPHVQQDPRFRRCRAPLRRHI